MATGVVLALAMASVGAWAQGAGPADHPGDPVGSAWRCVLPYGQAVTSAMNLRERFPLALASCEARPARRVAAPARLVPAAAMPPAAWPAPVVVIQAPSTVARRAPPDTPRGSDTPPSADSEVTPAAAEATHQAIVLDSSRRHGLDPALVMAMIQVESGQDARARSPKGALGLMQVMPATARRFGLADANALFNPRTNIEVGTRYLAHLQTMFDGRVDLMLAAYNAGEGAVVKHGMKVPPYAESQAYVRRVMARMPHRPNRF